MTDFNLKFMKSITICSVLSIFVLGFSWFFISSRLNIFNTNLQNFEINLGSVTEYEGISSNTREIRLYFEETSRIIFFLNLFQFLTIVLIIIICIVICKKKLNSLILNFSKLEEVIDSLKKGKVLNTDFTILREMAQKIIKLDETYKKIITNLIKNIKNIEMSKNIEYIENNEDFRYIFNFSDYNKTLERILFKMKEIDDELGNVDIKRNFNNSFFENTKQKIIYLNNLLTKQKSNILSINEFLMKIKVGDFSARLRLDGEMEVMSVLNNIVLDLNSFLKDLDRVFINNFTQTINTTYEGKYDQTKNNLNRAVENYNQNISALDKKIKNLEEIEKQMKVIERPKKRTYGEVVLKPVLPIHKFKTIDFTGSGFGKY
ncbi:MAG: hypothetical protein FWF57_02040 [Defluviitaleaceae bacterium]|nr:hypothetical protein [Defluviitaleaceae bacterium]